jgi:multicomponent Na+:H+ antiporter subunit D
MIFCIVGALSISAFPLFSGFISKSLIISASADGGHFIVWLVLMAASVGVLEHAGIKIPYSMFFGHDRGLKVKEAPLHMLIVMALAAALCIAIGVRPEPLYDLLPYPVAYTPYTTDHVVTQLQLLFFAVLAFAMLIRLGLYPAELPGVNLDTDWLYRRFLPRLVGRLATVTRTTWQASARFARRRTDRVLVLLFQAHGPQGPLARTWPTGSMVLWIAVLLGITLALSYL